MIITRLTLNNFGVYAGINTFEFHNEKPVILIGGMNGHGKTTFLDAVLLALYGVNSFAYTESRFKTYGQYLRAFVNKADGSLITSVELEFTLEQDSKERYLIRREWSAKGKRTREHIFVYKNGELDDFLTGNWSMFMETILPSGLSNFFFFDGEKIAELAVEKTNAQMKESIKALLGISVLDVLSNDLGRILAKANKKITEESETIISERLKEKKEQAEIEFDIQDEIILTIEKELESSKKRLERLKVEYTSKGGDIVEQRQELISKKNKFAFTVEQETEELIGIASGELPLLLVKDLLMRIEEQAVKEHEAKMFEEAIDRINSIYNDFAQENGSFEQVEGFIEYAKRKVKAKNVNYIYNLSDTALYQLQGMLDGKLNNIKKTAVMTKEKRVNAKAQADEIDSYLSIDLDEKALAKIYKNIKKTEQEIIEKEVVLEAEKKKRTSFHGNVIRTTAEYNRSVEKLLSELELSDDSERIIKYVHQANTVLNEYKVQLQRSKIHVLAETMTVCYKQLANKKNLIEKICIDPVSLDLSYINADGVIVPKESLSAGEKQLMVISLLWSLAICSKKKLPVIIDTPLSRMDSDHRISLITTYFPHASDQTIILSTDSEIDEKYYKIMRDNVGDEFTLVYDEKRKSSSIVEGYARSIIDAN